MADTTASIHAATDAPVTLSFPAILRNPGIKSRYAHLHAAATAAWPEQPPSRQITAKRVQRDQNEGKRWVRRKDNARFVGNPHVVAATKGDYLLQPPSNKPTFPEPLPSYLPRTVRVPFATLPTRDPVSANAGRFSLSMRGMRKDLRRAGARAEVLVQDVETEMAEWLQGGVMLRPDESNAADIAALQVNPRPGICRAIGSTGSITEVSRTPLQLVWSIADDAFARYIVHCCARYHNVVSFSKGNSSERLTYLLRPNVWQPDYRAPTALETPPVTDLDYTSQLESTDIDSDFISDRDLVDSEIDEQSADPRTTAPTQTIPSSSGTLDSIQESSLPSSPLTRSRTIDDIPIQKDGWSVVSGDPDADGDESGSEVGQDLVDSITSLTLGDAKDTVHQSGEAIDETEEYGAHDGTLTQNATSGLTQGRHEEGKDIPPPVRISYHRQPLHLSGRRWDRGTSSPSRSPARAWHLRPAKKNRRGMNRRGSIAKPTSFYNFLFS